MEAMIYGPGVRPAGTATATRRRDEWPRRAPAATDVRTDRVRPTAEVPPARHVHSEEEERHAVDTDPGMSSAGRAGVRPAPSRAPRLGPSGSARLPEIPPREGRPMRRARPEDRAEAPEPTARDHHVQPGPSRGDWFLLAGRPTPYFYRDPAWMKN